MKFWNHFRFISGPQIFWNWFNTLELQYNWCEHSWHGQTIFDYFQNNDNNNANSELTYFKRSRNFRNNDSIKQ